MKYVLFVFVAFVTQVSFAQSKVEIQKIKNGEFEYIKPTIDVLVYFSELSVSDWKNLIISNGYKDFGGFDNTLVYTKGLWGEKIKHHTISKDIEVVGMSWQNFEDKFLIMSFIEKELNPYYVKTIKGFRYYLIVRDGKNYQFAFKSDKENGIEDLFVTKL